MKSLSGSLEETNKIAVDFLDTIEPAGHAAVAALQGDLGAGKTAFAQEVGKILGVADNMHSPTFVIEKIYPINWKGFKNLIHVDAYRLEKESELLHLGWEELVRESPKSLKVSAPMFSTGPETAKETLKKKVSNTNRLTV